MSKRKCCKRCKQPLGTGEKNHCYYCILILIDYLGKVKK